MTAPLLCAAAWPVCCRLAPACVLAQAPASEVDVIQEADPRFLQVGVLLRKRMRLGALCYGCPPASSAMLHRAHCHLASASACLSCPCSATLF